MSDWNRQSSAGSSGEDALAHFDQRASDWHELYSRPQFRDRLHLFVSAVETRVARGGTILDYGCGSGAIAMALASAGYHVYGVDGAHGMIERAKSEAQRHGIENVEFEHLGDTDSWRPSERFDGVICSSVIEYVSQDEKLVRKLAEATAPQGWLFISIPSVTSLTGRLEDLFTKLRSEQRDVVFARRRYSKRKFSRTLETASMRVTDTINFEFPVLGRFGVLLSRLAFIGVMSLVIARKDAPPI